MNSRNHVLPYTPKPANGLAAHVAEKAATAVIIKIGEKGERIPLTIAAADEKKGTITLVVQQVGVTSSKLIKMEVGDDITDWLAL